LKDFLPNLISAEAEQLCQVIPNYAVGDIIREGDICAVIEGFGRHFPYELLPSFARNCRHLHDASSTDGWAIPFMTTINCSTTR